MKVVVTYDREGKITSAARVLTDHETAVSPAEGERSLVVDEEELEAAALHARLHELLEHFRVDVESEASLVRRSR